MPYIDETGNLVVEDDRNLNAFFEVERASETLRSEEVTEIISSKPSFLVRWGITIFFLILVCIVAACLFIQYPDVVPAKAKLTSINAPKEVKTRSEGKLIALFAKEDQQVKEEEILGFIESRSNHVEVINLSKLIDRLQVQLNNNQTEVLQSLRFKSFMQLGEVQQHFQTFILALNVYKQYLSSGYFVKKKAMIRKDFQYLDKLNSNLALQRSKQEEDLVLQQETFKANEYLNKEKVISNLEFRNEKSKLLGKELSIPQISSSIISNESSKHDKQKEIMELENQVAQQKGIFFQALNTFKAQLDDWKSKYLLVSPVDGKVAFATFLQENQQLQNNQTICFVNPGNSEYYAEVFIPQTNFGKLKNNKKFYCNSPLTHTRNTANLKDVWTLFQTFLPIAATWRE